MSVLAERFLLESSSYVIMQAHRYLSVIDDARAVPGS